MPVAKSLVGRKVEVWESNRGAHRLCYEGLITDDSNKTLVVKAFPEAVSAVEFYRDTFGAKGSRRYIKLKPEGV